MSRVATGTIVIVPLQPLVGGAQWTLFLKFILVGFDPSSVDPVTRGKSISNFKECQAKLYEARLPSKVNFAMLYSFEFGFIELK